LQWMPRVTRRRCRKLHSPATASRSRRSR